MITLLAARQRKPALDHAPRAVADQGAGDVVGDRGHALAAEDDVEGVDEVGGGVDERAVEIEDDGRACHGDRMHSL